MSEKRAKLVFNLVDLQNSFVNPKGELYVPNAEKKIPTFVNILKFGKKYQIPLIATMDWHTEKTAELKRNNGVFNDHCMANTWGAEIIPELLAVTPFNYAEILSVSQALIDNTLFQALIDNQQFPAVIRKDQPDVWEKDTLSNLMIQYAEYRYKGATIVVFGVATDYYVKANVMGWLQRKFNVVVIEDAIAGVNIQPEDSATAITEMKKEGAKFMKWSTFIDEFGSTEDRFKDTF